jgi:hypothetical protein
MIIQGASLVNRFYASDGWTAELVAELLADPDVKWVTTRYDNEGHMDASPHDMERRLPSYFAVYEVGMGRGDADPKPPPFLLSKVKKHKYNPFSGMSRTVYDCDRYFSTKNKMIDDTAEAKNAGQGNNNRRGRRNKRRRA